MYCFGPVLKGYWRQHELWDGTYDLYDLIDIHLAMEAQSINEQIVQKHFEDKRNRQMDLDRLRRSL
jgi:hypothetical protein